MKTNKIILAASLLTLSLLIFGCSMPGSAQQNSAEIQTAAVTTLNFSDTIQTTGSVAVQLIANLSWKTSGTVESVSVQVGDRVQSGEQLAVLSAESVPGSMITTRTELVAAQKAMDDLLNSNLARAQAQANLTKYQDALETAQEKRQSKEYQRAADYTIDEAYANYILAKDEADRQEERYDTVDDRPEDDPVRAAAFSAWAAAKETLAHAEANYRYLLTDPDEMEIALADSNLALAQAQYDDALREWNRLKDGPDERDIEAAQARIDAAQANVNTQFILAPFAGEVLSIETIPGSQVSSGTVAIVIADRRTTQIETQVDELDIVRIQLGSPAEITLDALPDQVMAGKVSAINPVGSSVNGLVKYTVSISLDENETSLYFGSTANVTIMVSAAQDRLATSLQAIQNDDQGEFVMKQTPDGSFARVDIQSYDIVDDLVIITGDLQDGDVLQLASSNLMEQMAEGNPLMGQ